jgi:hypothetical protein
MRRPGGRPLARTGVAATPAEATRRQGASDDGAERRAMEAELVRGEGADRKYAVRAFRPGDEQGLVALYNAVWTPAGLPGRDEAAWRWQYADAPHGHWTTVACASESGEVIAAYSGVPLACEVRGEPVLGCLCIDSMVHPQWRHGLQREGPFLAAARAFYAWFGEQPGVHCNYGFPNRGAKRIGERLLRYLPLHDPMPVLYHNLFDGGARLRHVPAPGLEVLDVARFDAAADHLWRRVRAGYPFAVRRDAAYLNWRYADCPQAFLTWEVRSGRELRGIAVLREHWVGQPILALADYVGAIGDRACLAAVLERAVAHARGSGHARIEAWLPHWTGPLAAALDMGWRREESGILSVIRLPGRWDEYEWHHDHLFVTVGDSDIY